MFERILNTSTIIAIFQEFKNKKLVVVYVLIDVCFFVFCGFVF